MLCSLAKISKNRTLLPLMCNYFTHFLLKHWANNVKVYVKGTDKARHSWCACFLGLAVWWESNWNICILYCIMSPTQNDCGSCKRQGGMFSVLMGTLRKVPILPDISYSHINVVYVGLSIMKIRGEQVNYISMTE